MKTEGSKAGSALPYPLHPEAVPYRAWAVMVTHDPEIFTQVVERAVAEAPRYNINRIEFHDFLYPSPAPEGFVDNVVRFEDFPELTGRDSWTFHKGHPISNAELDINVAHFREAARIVKQAGLTLNVWCHSFRELPIEFYQAYESEFRPDSDFLYTTMEKILDEFLRKVPEVDGLTLTSLGETVSFAEMQGVIPLTERMYKFYSAAHRACSKNGRQLILRDFGAEDEFWEVADKLPDDVIYMTKFMPSDWERVNLPISYRLTRAMGRRYVLEWDLRGEYLGQGFVPYANPRHFWHNLLNVKIFQPEGHVGRIHWTDWKGKQHEWSTVFDAVNGLNVHVFSKAMCGESRYRKPKYIPGTQGEHLPYSWIREWVVENYGPKSWPELWEVLKQTPLLIEKFATCADRHTSDHSFLNSAPYESHLENVRSIVREAGVEYIDVSKRRLTEDATRLAEEVMKLQIEPEKKKLQLQRSFRILAAFGELRRIWLLFFVRLTAWHDGGRGEEEGMLADYESTLAESARITNALGGGLARMIDDRIQYHKPGTTRWIKDGSHPGW